MEQEKYVGSNVLSEKPIEACHPERDSDLAETRGALLGKIPDRGPG